MKKKVSFWILSFCLGVLASCSGSGNELMNEQDPEGKFRIEIETQFYNENGTLTRAETDMGYTTGAGLYNKWDNCTVAAFAKEGYELESFTDNDGHSGSNSYTFYVDKDKKFVAKFRVCKKLVYTLVTTQDGVRVTFPRVTAKDIKVDYGDGTFASVDGTDPYVGDIPPHVYARAGEYAVKISTPNPVAKLYFGNALVKDVISINLDLSQLTSADHIFSESPVESICSGFFDGCKENLLSAEHAFYRCYNLKTLPSGLFKGCKNITSFIYCFEEAGLTSIPANTFEGCSGVIDFTAALHQCGDLRELPAGLVDGLINVEKMWYSFGTLNITSIPPRFFSKNTKLKNAKEIFSACRSLTTVPYDIFDGCVNLENIEGGFRQSPGITSKVPDLWNKIRFPKITNFYECYRDVTNAANFSEIPQSWK